MAHDYSHLTGGGGQETNVKFLQGQNNQLQGEVQRLNQELAARAMPVLANFTDAVMTNVRMAQMGSPQALDQLKLLLEAISQADSMVKTKGKIVLPR